MITVGINVNAEIGSVYPSLLWDGYNQYHKPMATTYYYGSGDVNLDGKVDSQDVTMFNDILAGKVSKNIMADVNGDGDVLASDYSLFIKGH